MSATDKTIPIPNELTKAYWDAAHEHRFVLQCCVSCGLFNAKPRVICPRCHQDEFTWTEPSGRGSIHSFAIVRQSQQPGFKDDIPFVVVNIQLEDEPTCYLTTNLIVDESEYATLHIDQRVVVTFEDRGEVTVPQFKLA